MPLYTYKLLFKFGSHQSKISKHTQTKIIIRSRQELIKRLIIKLRHPILCQSALPFDRYKSRSPRVTSLLQPVVRAWSFSRFCHDTSVACAKAASVTDAKKTF
jgi:hypothetical protein